MQTKKLMEITLNTYSPPTFDMLLRHPEMIGMMHPEKFFNYDFKKNKWSVCENFASGVWG